MKRNRGRAFLSLALSIILMFLMIPCGAMASPDADAAKSDTSGSGKSVAQVTVSEDGLPAKGLLLTMDPNTQPSSDGRYPGFFVKMNPCSTMAHNAQPDNYMSTALATCMYIYTYNKEKGTYVEKGRKGPIESYGDTEDLSHSFYVNLKPGQVAAFVPKNMGEKDRVGKEPTEADHYCFRYEIALSTEEEWKLTGAGNKGKGSAVLNHQVISGGYITSELNADHPGEPREEVVASTSPRDDGCVVSFADLSKEAVDEDQLTNAGLVISAKDLPASGIRSPLTLKLTVPYEEKNGEGGFGFSCSGSYRESFGAAWTYPIKYVSGAKFAVIEYRKQEDGKYAYVRHITCEAENGQPASVNLTALHLQKGDVVTVVPICPDYAAPIDQDLKKGTFTQKTNAKKFISQVVPVRKFHFSYELSMQHSEDTLAVTACEGPDPVQGSNSYSAKADICDEGIKRVSLAVSVKSSGKASRTGFTEKGLPSYGLLIEKNSSFPAELYIDPELSPGESCAYFAIEDYEKKSDGTYEKINKTVRLARANKMMHTTIMAFPQGTVVSVRRVVPDDGAKAFPSSCGMAEKARKENYELTDDEGNVIYPTEGKDHYILNPYGNYADRGMGAVGRVKTGGIPNSDYELWRTADPGQWIRGEGTLVPFTALTANSFTTDLGEEKTQIAAVRAREEAGDKKDNIKLKKQTLPETIADGTWPEGALVIVRKDRSVKAEEDRGANFLVNISAPGGEVFYHSSGTKNDDAFAGSLTQHVMCHLYQRVKEDDGSYIWKKAAATNSEDWINSGDSKNFPRMDVSSAYFYGIHAHLKNDEAMVVLPAANTYDLTYWVDMTDGKDYDVLPGKCLIPSSAQHISRTYFAGTHRNNLTQEENGFSRESGKADVLTITTAKKNAGKSANDALSVISDGVAPLKVNLFDYDFGDKTHFLKGKQTQQLHFSYDPKNEYDDDWNMWHAGPCPGIVKDTLGKDGLPQFSVSTPFSSKNVSLFDTTDVEKETDGGTKKVFRDIDFDFLYDADDHEYSYTSAMNAAVYKPKENRVVQYSKLLGIDGWDEKGAGFFPFNSFSEDGVWGTEDKNNAGTYLINDDAIDDHFGMSMVHSFYIPKGKKINGKDMVFRFSGDDDAWFFVDGKLVLDMGGIHERVSGEVNFTKGTYEVKNSVSPWIIAASESQTVRTVNGTLPEFKEGSEHEFAFFYLERGGTLSDLTIDFNLPEKEKPKTPEEPPKTPEKPSETPSSNDVPKQDKPPKTPDKPGKTSTPSNPWEPVSKKENPTVTPAPSGNSVSVPSTPEPVPSDKPQTTPKDVPSEVILHAGSRSGPIAYGVIGVSFILAFASALTDHRKHGDE